MKAQIIGGFRSSRMRECKIGGEGEGVVGVIFIGSSGVERTWGPEFSVCPAMKLRNHKSKRPKTNELPNFHITVLQ